MAIFYQRFVIESSLPVQEAWKRLLPAVRIDSPICAKCGQSEAGGVRFCSKCGQPVAPLLPQARGLFTSGGFEFEGDVSPEGFNISRIISYRNSCIPVIRGRFEPSATGTSIVIEMRMHPAGFVFLVGGMGLSFLVLSVTSGSGQGSPVAAVAAFAAPCVIFAVCWIAFAAEANTARAALDRYWPASR